MKKSVTILIPAYNEELTIDSLYERLVEVTDSLQQKYKFTFLFIDDGSKDSTLDKIEVLNARDNRVTCISLSRNYGKEIAMLAGFDFSDSDATVIIDADLQDPPELIPEMIKYWEEGYDDVYAKRKSRGGESWLKRFTSKHFYRILQKTTNIPIQQDTGDFRLLDKKCIVALRQMRESHRYTKGMFSWIGFSKKEILYDRDPRLAGTSKWNYGKLLELAVEGILSFTTKPLRVATILGLVASAVAFLYTAVIIIRTIVFGVSVAGYPSLMVAILFLGGIQLLSLGIIGEYIGRIFNETKNRPTYYYGKKIGFDKSTNQR